MTRFSDRWNVRLLEKVVSVTCFLVSAVHVAGKCLPIPMIPWVGVSSLGLLLYSDPSV